MNYITIIIIVVIFFGLQYFLTFKPQQKKQLQHSQMLESLIPGDKVRTVGGFLGIVQTIYEDAFVLAMEPDGVKMEVQRDAISEKIEEVNYESGFEDAEPQQIEEDDEK